MYKTEVIEKVEYYIWTMTAVSVHVLNVGFISALVGLITALLILYLPRLPVGLLNSLGISSYSLYLTHLLIGGKLVHLGVRIAENSWARSSIFIFALVLSIVFANVFYWIIERPSHQFARVIRGKIQAKSM